MFTKNPKTLDTPSIFLLFHVLWIPAIRLRDTVWVPNLDIVELFGFLVVILGLWISYSAFRGIWAHLILGIFTICVPFWVLISRLELNGEWLIRVISFISRLEESLSQMIAGLPIQDPGLFLVFCSLTIWLLGYISVFGLVRFNNPWVGLLPTAAIYGIIDFYDPTPGGQRFSGAIMVICLVLLAARLFWVRSNVDWKKKGVLVERDAGEIVLQISVVSAFVLVLIAWNFRGFIQVFTSGTRENRRISQTWRQIQTKLENNFIALRPGTSLTGSYAEGMRLGSQTPTSQIPAFQVKVENHVPNEPVIYWRVRTYEKYQDGMWISSPLTDENTSLIRKNYRSDDLIFTSLNFDFTWNDADGSLVPMPGRLAGLDIPFTIRTPQEMGGLPGDGLVFPGEYLQSGDQFIVHSLIFTGAAEELRATVKDTPDWVKDHYLQLPEDLPARVGELSAEIAKGGTIFDRVIAVTSYLRENYKYAGSIPEPPSAIDPVDWFLFDQKTGFCNYYASAEVILLRSAGIPARLAVGYSQGESIPGGYQVRLNNGHAWPEVYFSGIGWIPFEPTVSRPPLTYQSGPGEEESDLALQLDIRERHPVDDLENPSFGMISSPLEESTSQYRLSIKNTAYLFLIVLCLTSLYLQRSRTRGWTAILTPQVVLSWFEKRGIPPPTWVRSWDWYTRLSQSARQYYRLEWLAVRSRIIDGRVKVPSELFDRLRKEFPAVEHLISEFQTGFYAEIYSEQRQYDREACRVAGKGLQQVLVKRWLTKKN